MERSRQSMVLLVVAVARVTFAILAGLCVLGVAATLVGPRRSEAAAGAVAGAAGEAPTEAGSD